MIGFLLLLLLQEKNIHKIRNIQIAKKDTVQFSYIIGFNVNFRTFHHFTSCKIVNQSLDLKTQHYVPKYSIDLKLLRNESVSKSLPVFINLFTTVFLEKGVEQC